MVRSGTGLLTPDEHEALRQLKLRAGAVSKQAIVAIARMKRTVSGRGWRRIRFYADARQPDLLKSAGRTAKEFEESGDKVVAALGSVTQAFDERVSRASTSETQGNVTAGR
jgi:hypothetical protein